MVINYIINNYLSMLSMYLYHVFLYNRFAGNKSTIKDVAQRFNVTESSFERIRERMFGFLLEIGPMAIKMPSTTAKINMYKLIPKLMKICF